MLAHVAHEARLSAQVADGSTVRDHLAVAVRIGRKTQAAVDGPEPPPGLLYVLEWHHEISASRSVGPAGLNPISYVDIDAWARLTDRRPRPHEVQALLRIDYEVRRPGACRCDLCESAKS